MHNVQISTQTNGEEKKEYLSIGSCDSIRPVYHFEITEEKLQEYIGRISQFAVNLNIQQDLLVTAIQNLLRKKNFLELFQQLLNEDITNEMFENEIQSNQNKYTINLNKNVSSDEYSIIVNIISRIGFEIKNFSHIDVAELFSVNPDSLLSHSEELLREE